jgi:hypothetical protein
MFDAAGCVETMMSHGRAPNFVMLARKLPRCWAAVAAGEAEALLEPWMLSADLSSSGGFR